MGFATSTIAECSETNSPAPNCLVLCCHNQSIHSIILLKNFIGKQFLPRSNLKNKTVSELYLLPVFENAWQMASAMSE